MASNREEKWPAHMIRAARAQFEKRLASATHHAAKARAFWDATGALPDGTTDRWRYLCQLGARFQVGAAALAKAAGWGRYEEDGGVIPNTFFDAALGLSREERARLLATRQEREEATARAGDALWGGTSNDEDDDEGSSQQTPRERPAPPPQLALF